MKKEYEGLTRNCPLRTGLRPCDCDLPRCPICNYTEHDAAFEADHALCPGRIPSVDGWTGADESELPGDDFAVINLSAIPLADRPMLTSILQQAVDRLGDAGWTPEREDAVLRELLRQHMRGLIGDAAKQEAWHPLLTAPKDATWVEGLLSNGSTVVMHWAEDLSGECHPAFRGWFRDDGNSFIEVRPESWRPLAKV